MSNPLGELTPEEWAAISGESAGGGDLGELTPEEMRAIENPRRGMGDMRTAESYSEPMNSSVQEERVIGLDNGEATVERRSPGAFRDSEGARVRGANRASRQFTLPVTEITGSTNPPGPNYEVRPRDREYLAGGPGAGVYADRTGQAESQTYVDTPFGSYSPDAFGVAAGQVPSFGFTDEIGGAVRSARDGISYQEGVGQARGVQDRLRQQNPGSTTAGTATGLALSAPLLAEYSGMGAGSTAMQRMGSVVGTGALSALGHSQESGVNTIPDMLDSVPSSMVLGTAAEALPGGLNALANARNSAARRMGPLGRRLDLRARGVRAEQINPNIDGPEVADAAAYARANIPAYGSQARQYSAAERLSLESEAANLRAGQMAAENEAASFELNRRAGAYSYSPRVQSALDSDPEIASLLSTPAETNPLLALRRPSPPAPSGPGDIIRAPKRPGQFPSRTGMSFPSIEPAPYPQPAPGFAQPAPMRQPPMSYAIEPLPARPAPPLNRPAEIPGSTLSPSQQRLLELIKQRGTQTPPRSPLHELGAAGATAVFTHNPATSIAAAGATRLARAYEPAVTASVVNGIRNILMTTPARLGPAAGPMLEAAGRGTLPAAIWAATPNDDFRELLRQMNEEGDE